MAAVTACTSAPVVASLASQKTISSRKASVAAPKLPVNRSRLVMSASEKKQDLAVPTTLAVLATFVIPEVAEAAIPGVSPSLKNLLLSVLAGGVVLGGIAGAVAGVSLFDPVNRK